MGFGGAAGPVAEVPGLQVGFADRVLEVRVRHRDGDEDRTGVVGAVVDDVVERVDPGEARIRRCRTTASA